MAVHTANKTIETLGRALRAQRKALGISMAAAAEAAQMSRVTWHRLENGEPGVAWGSMLAAAAVLNMDVTLLPKTSDNPDPDDGEARPSLERWLPLEIALDDFPGLARLAWSTRGGRQTVRPHEAWQLYERNGRHLHDADVSPRERALIQALASIFGQLHAAV